VSHFGGNLLPAAVSDRASRSDLLKLPIIWSMAAMLRDSVVVVAVAVVRTRPRAIPLAMKAMRKSTHGFPFISYMGMGLRLAALRAAGALLKATTYYKRLCIRINLL